MENRINQVMELADGRKYIVVKQAIYKGNNYYVSMRLTENEEDVTDEIIVFQEIDNNGQKSVQKVTDPNLFSLVCKYVGLLDENTKI